MKSRFIEYLAPLAVVIPGIALLSANIYFFLRSLFVKLVPFTAYSLQDHFDKSIDFLVPIFVFGGLASFSAHVFGGIRLLNRRKGTAAEGGDTKLQLGEKIYIVSFFLGLPLVALGIAIFLPVDHWALAEIAALVIFVPFIAEFVRDKYSHYTDVSGLTIYRRASSFCVFFIAILGLIMNASVSDIVDAKVRHLESGSTAIIDQTSLGLLVIKDRRYMVLGEGGGVLVEGALIETESSSIACKQLGGIFCFSTIDYEEEAKTR